MFNFIAASLMVYLLVSVLIKPGQMSPETRTFEEAAWLPFMHEFLALFGIEVTRTPLNLSLFFALACCLFVWVYVWRTRWGYELRTAGQSEPAAVYAGIRPRRIIVSAMCLSGALAGFVRRQRDHGCAPQAAAELHRRLRVYRDRGVADGPQSSGRHHHGQPAVRRGCTRAGAELAFEIPTITREMVVAIQGLIILFSGALALMLRPWVVRVYLKLRPVQQEVLA